MRVTKQPLTEQRLVFAGAGAAAQGIGDLFVLALQHAGLTRDEARRHVWTVDSKGLVVADRPNLDDFKRAFARDATEAAAYPRRDGATISLHEVIAHVQPTILLGTSGTAGMFSETIVRAMAAQQTRPIIFPLSNPTSKAECTAADAIRWSDGHALVATGSPFEPVLHGGKRYRIGQGNNAYIFPGVGLGVTTAKIRRVTDGMFLAAARALASVVTPRDLNEGALFPALPRIREASLAVAVAVVRRAVEESHAAPKVLHRLESTLQQAMWTPAYLPLRYEA